MKKETKKAPTIRFRGFTDDWEQRKLGELVIIERGGSPRPIDAYITEAQDGLNWVKIGDAPEQGRYITHTKEKIKPSGLSKTRQVFPGDLILSNSMSFGKPYIMGITGCIHDGWLLIRNNQNVFDLKFLCQMLGTKQMLVQYRRLAAGSTVNNLNKELVANAIVKVPEITEQEQIGAFLENLDNVITLHQRKLDQLKTLKKYFLQNMFPAKGEKVPRIRFKGFTGDWEQRKLGECCQEFKSGSFIPASDIGDVGKYPVYGGNGLRGFSSEYNHDGEFALIGRQGALCGNMNYSVGRAYFTEHAIAVQANKTADTKFLYYLLKKMNLGQYSDQSAQPGLAVGKLVKLIELVPFVAEQIKIGHQFMGIDNLITLHQRKLNQLQTMKKFMLQNLFI